MAENAARQINGVKRVIKKPQFSGAALKLTGSQSKPLAQTADTHDLILGLLDGSPIAGLRRELLRRALRRSGLQVRTVVATPADSFHLPARLAVALYPNRTCLNSEVAEMK